MGRQLQRRNATGLVTAPVVVEDLSTFEFNLSCECHDCDKPAAVMCKGCGDSRHYAICRPHLDRTRRWFKSKSAVVCKICYRPWVNFDTHYDVQDI